jgi:hypothetical protein
MAFPPLRTRPAEPVSAAAALEMLQAFLDAAATSAHLAPNAMLQPGGPASQGRPGASLVMHNLKRVEAGLRGEWLAPRLDLDGTETGVCATAAEDGLDTDAEREKEGWVDLETYRRQQSVAEGDGTQRDAERGPAGDHKVSMSIEEIAVPGGELSGTVDRETRKREKKARRDKEKRVKKQKTKE